MGCEGRRICSLLYLLLLGLSLSQGDRGTGGTESVEVTDQNWAQILQGEWMVEFFAPWCPACRSLQPIWTEFASWSTDLGIRVGQVDVTLSPGLGGRFMIAALPTIYHVKDGVFRQYRGGRSKEELLSFIEELKWEKVEPVSSWSAPTSVHMSVVSHFYRLSLFVRNLMTALTTQYGLPVWATYLLFGGATILAGLLLGLLLVCLIDFVYLPVTRCSSKPPPPLPSPEQTGEQTGEEGREEGEGSGKEEGEERRKAAEGPARKRRVAKVD